MTSSYNDSVAAEVRVHMARRQLSQLDLAVALGWSQPYLSRRLTGAVPWSTDDIERIAKELDIPVHELVSPRQAS